MMSHDDYRAIVRTAARVHDALMRDGILTGGEEADFDFIDRFARTHVDAETIITYTDNLDCIEPQNYEGRRESISQDDEQKTLLRLALNCFYSDVVDEASAKGAA